MAWAPLLTHAHHTHRTYSYIRLDTFTYTNTCACFYMHEASINSGSGLGTRLCTYQTCAQLPVYAVYVVTTGHYYNTMYDLVIIMHCVFVGNVWKCGQDINTVRGTQRRAYRDHTPRTLSNEPSIPLLYLWAIQRHHRSLGESARPDLKSWQLEWISHVPSVKVANSVLRRQHASWLPSASWLFSDVPCVLLS